MYVRRQGRDHYEHDNCKKSLHSRHSSCGRRRGKVLGLGAADCRVAHASRVLATLAIADSRRLRPVHHGAHKIPLRPRMKFPVHRFQSLLIDMRVNLCRRNIGMAEHLLNDAQVSAIPQ